MAIPLKEFEKDPQSVLDYTIDWGTWLNGDEISTSAWAIGTGSLGDTTLALTTDSNTTEKATAWLSSGKHGQSYAATNTIVTVGGRTVERSIVLILRSQ